MLPPVEIDNEFERQVAGLRALELSSIEHIVTLVVPIYPKFIETFVRFVSEELTAFEVWESEGGSYV